MLEESMEQCDATASDVRAHHQVAVQKEMVLLMMVLLMMAAMLGWQSCSTKSRDRDL